MFGTAIRMSLPVVVLWLAAPAAQAAEFDVSWYSIDGGGIMGSEGGEFVLNGTIGQPDAGVMSGGDFALVGGFWAVASSPACSQTGPFVVHAAAAPAPAGSASAPCTGYIDPRVERGSDPGVELGIDRVVFVFNEPVVAVGGGALGTGDFVVTHTGGGLAPGVAAVEMIDDLTYRVILDRVVDIQEWTTIQANVQNACGAIIEDAGNQGPGALEPDRIDIGRLPGDITNDGQVTPADLITLRQFIAGSAAAPCGSGEFYFDIDRDGAFPQPQDLIRYRQLIAGTGNATMSWAGVPMNAVQP